MLLLVPLAFAEDSSKVCSYPPVAQSKKALRTIRINKSWGQGAFIAPDLFLTVFHHLAELGEEADWPPPYLVATESAPRFDLENLLAVSVFDDLALFKIPSGDFAHLNLADKKAGVSSKLCLISFAHHSTKNIVAASKIGPKIHSDENNYTFLADRIGQRGFSGGPILNSEGELVGILKSGESNLLTMVPLEKIKNFAIGEIDLPCISFPTIGQCIASEMRELAQKGEEGDALAIYLLGEYHRAKGEWEQSYAFYYQGMQKGHIPSKYKMAISNYQGLGVVKDLPLAFQQIREVAKEGHFLAKYALGYFYLEGIGVEKDPATALDYLLEVGERGYADGEYELGRIYHYGLPGIAKDPTKSRNFVERAAAKGHPLAEQTLKALGG